MNYLKVVEKFYHHNGGASPFYAAIVDDPNDGDTKLVIMFDEPDCTAVLSLDKLINDEDVSSHNSYSGDKYDARLRDVLWNSGDE
jgi:hypothetical protein